VNWEEITTYAKLSHDNFIVGVVNGAQLHEARSRQLPFYHQAHLHSFQELNDLRQAGISEAYIGSPLFFQLDRVKKNFPTIKIRAIANVAWPEGTMSYSNGVCGTWIRPEDVTQYEPYIDTIEFIADQKAEQALYRIYAVQHRWPGELNYLVRDLDHPASNRMIPPECAKARLNCSHRCVESNNCHICQRYFDLANPDRLRNYLEAMKHT
jgi:hypothetical protein